MELLLAFAIAHPEAIRAGIDRRRISDKKSRTLPSIF